MRKYTICCVDGCGIPIIGSRCDWASPICVGCLPPPKPLPKVKISNKIKEFFR